MTQRGKGSALSRIFSFLFPETLLLGVIHMAHVCEQWNVFMYSDHIDGDEVKNTEM